MIVFGPVTSRRLGKSLGINHIPPKYCSYSCVYCQVGNTIHKTDQRQSFYDPDNVYEIVKDKLYQLDQISEGVDYITMVPDGEPALDKNVKELIIRLKKLGPPVAIISNGSLMNDENVRNAFLHADWVCVKIDTVDPEVWRKINRPYTHMDLSDILDGVVAFAKEFSGIFNTETMLVNNLNDSLDIIKDTSRFISRLNPKNAYLLIPTRPPAESWVQSPDEQNITKVYYMFKENFKQVTLLIDFPSENIRPTNHLEDELLAITSVHPLRKEDADRMIKNVKGDSGLINQLLEEKQLKQTSYRGHTFYVRKFTK